MRAAWWWMDRWQKSTAFKDLTLAEQGAYRNLLDELWLRDGALRDDDRVLAKCSGDALEWPKIRERVMAHFHLVDGAWRNETHDEVQAESSKRATIQKRYRDRKRERAVVGYVTDNVIHNAKDNDRPNVGSSPSPDPDTSNVLRTTHQTDRLAPTRDPLRSTAAANPLMAGRRPEIEKDGYRLIREINALEPDRDPLEILMEAAGYETKDGKLKTACRLETMTDDHLARTIHDLRENLAEAKADGDKKTQGRRG